MVTGCRPSAQNGIKKVESFYGPSHLTLSYSHLKSVILD